MRASQAFEAEELCVVTELNGCLDPDRPCSCRTSSMLLEPVDG
jgi:hypothetical protein